MQGIRTKSQLPLGSRGRDAVTKATARGSELDYCAPMTLCHEHSETEPRSGETRPESKEAEAEKHLRKGKVGHARKGKGFDEDLPHLTQKK